MGSAIAPAVAAMYKGESADSPNNEQNSRVNEFEISFQASLL